MKKKKSQNSSNKKKEIIYIFVFSWTIVFRNEPLDHS